MTLEDYALTPRFSQEATLHPGLHLARVVSQNHQLYTLTTGSAEFLATVTGKLAHDAHSPADFPAVGDWVMVDRPDDQSGRGQIHAILTRKSLFLRKAAGSAQAVQVVAANVDTVFLCMAVGGDYNLRRLERYLTIAYDSMATPVVVLTKADLAPDIQALQDEIATVSIATDVIATSSQSVQGLQQLQSYLRQDQTVAFLGSSGVGKSTLINRLLGREELATQAVRADDQKGRHTTTSRQLLVLPTGGVVIDTPGMREIQIETGNLDKSFADIQDLAAGCKFRNCTHTSEPGCAVQQAIAQGALSPQRLASFRKLENEMGYDGLSSRERENKKLETMLGVSSASAGRKLMKEVRQKSKRKS